MRRGVIAVAVMVGMCMLYAQAASAGEMVRYEHTLYVADASDKTDKTKNSKKSEKATNVKKDNKASHKRKRHHQQHRKHHHHHHHHDGHHHHHNDYWRHRDRDEGIRTQSKHDQDELYGQGRQSRATSFRQKQMQEYINETAPSHR